MRRAINTAILLLFVVSVAGFNGCLQDRETEVVLNDENCEAFDENRTSVGSPMLYTLDVAAEVNGLLADNDVSREQILEAFLVSASYEITDYPTLAQQSVWEIAGAITVERVGSGNPPDTLLNYTDYITVSRAAVGEKTCVTLEEGGVAVVNDALADYIAGSNDVVLLFTVAYGDIEPDPSASNPMIFSWEFCLFMQVLTTLETEIFQVF